MVGCTIVTIIYSTSLKVYIIIDNDNYDELSLYDFNQYDDIIMATYNVGKDDYQVKVFNTLPIDKVTVVSMRSPYDYLFLNGVKNYICIYEATTLAINSLCDCMISNKFYGKLPISLDK